MATTNPERQRVIYVDEDGAIEKVTDGNGKIIDGKQATGNEKTNDILRWNPDERCVYSSTGRCYC